MSKWDIEKVKKDLQNAFDNNSEVELLKILKCNSFLFYELYSRKYGIQPAFHEIIFGATYRCDFAWLNDNSDGPEWVLVEIEKPKMDLFTKSNEPSSKLNHAIEQIRTWQRYFRENPTEKGRIFGAVARFKYILVAGSGNDWNKEHAMKWRRHHNSETDIEIRSTDVFIRAIKVLENNENELWSFEENPTTIPYSALKKYWENYSYMDKMRGLFQI